MASGFLVMGQTTFVSGFFTNFPLSSGVKEGTQNAGRFVLSVEVKKDTQLKRKFGYRILPNNRPGRF